ncbi:phage integrase N-terminal SAM-like domain-containing protein [Aneurinibacillus migulanus]|uniref:phage integrase N-terminal SAM-like domain-containing protein n=1 Tax=Aneurinibacillus migulanus TaxID=47500 RepID=UPI002E244346|nr:phage integrase N-terminal SAM-like domain-containing protein [Aneurinibacillus migulanus]MED4731997.1 phage integrase N-terminal SAM-like domain-containing protein [Aneurinibacillus migulanus]
MNHVHNFLEWMREEGKDPKTIVAYNPIVNKFMEWLQGNDTSIEQVKPIDVKEYLSFLRHTENKSQATINKATAGLITFFAWLVDNDIVKDNLMTRIKIQKVQASDEINKNDTMK